MIDIIIIGMGGHAKVLVEILQNEKLYRILGYTDIDEKVSNCKVKYLGSDSNLKKIIEDHPNSSAAIGVGKTTLETKREEIYKQLINFGFKTPSFVSKNAFIKDDVLIGEASQVFDKSYINIGSKVGKGVIINTNSLIEHDCEIGNFCHIAPSVTICGNVNIGYNTIIGAGTIIKNGITIGNNCYIGSGSNVVKDCLQEGLYYGNPARFIKKL